MANKYLISYNTEIQPDLQALCQSSTCQRFNQSFIIKLAKPTHCQKDNAAKMRDKLTKDKKGQLVTRNIAKKVLVVCVYMDYSQYIKQEDGGKMLTLKLDRCK